MPIQVSHLYMIVCTLMLCTDVPVPVTSASCVGTPCYCPYCLTRALECPVSHTDSTLSSTKFSVFTVAGTDSCFF